MENQIESIKNKIKELDSQLTQVTVVAVLGCSLAVVTFLFFIASALF